MIFFIRTLAPMIMKKLIAAAYMIEASLNEMLIARTIAARTIMKISVEVSLIFMFNGRGDFL